MKNSIRRPTFMLESIQRKFCHYIWMRNVIEYWKIHRKWKFSTILLLCNYLKKTWQFSHTCMSMAKTLRIKRQRYWKVRRQKWSNKRLCKNIDILWTKPFSFWLSFWQSGTMYQSHHLDKFRNTCIFFLFLSFWKI